MFQVKPDYDLFLSIVESTLLSSTTAEQQFCVSTIERPVNGRS